MSKMYGEIGGIYIPMLPLFFFLSLGVFSQAFTFHAFPIFPRLCPLPDFSTSSPKEAVILLEFADNMLIDGSPSYFKLRTPD